MAKIRSSEAALPLPINITAQQFDAIETRVRRSLLEQRQAFEDACNSYRDRLALQNAAARPGEVIRELSDLQAKLQAASEGVSQLLASSNPSAQQAVLLLGIKHHVDPEVEPLGDFSRRLRSMANLASVRLNEFKSEFAGRRGRDANLALDELIFDLAAVAQAAGIRLAANYSDASGCRLGPFVDLVREAYRISHGAAYTGSGLEERIARVLRNRAKMSKL